MFGKKIGVDIVAEIGGIRSIETAVDLFESKMNSEHLGRIRQIRNQEALLKIANAIAMCDPDTVFINIGSETDRHFIRELILQKREELNLAMENHTVHYDLKEEIIRKDYDYNLYEKQFSLYIDKIIARIDLQLESYGKEPNIPERLFEVLKIQNEALLCLKESFGAIVTPDQLKHYKV